MKECTGMGFGDFKGSERQGKVLMQRYLWCPDGRQGYGTEMREMR